MSPPVLFNVDALGLLPWLASAWHLLHSNTGTSKIEGKVFSQTSKNQQQAVFNYPFRWWSDSLETTCTERPKAENSGIEAQFTVDK